MLCNLKKLPDYKGDSRQYQNDSVLKERLHEIQILMVRDDKKH